MSAIVQAREAVQQLPPRRRLLLGGVVVGVVGALLLVARWASQPDYALLFGGLPAQEAGQVVEQLESQGVAYDLRDGGASIYVPREDVYGLRLRLATEGVVSEGPAGYELFDGGTLGMTDFMQRLNVKRALEGELARTIASVRQVERARVHLVLPERSPFQDRQVPASASVVLGVRGSLGPDQVAGVTALVAGAVEGLSTNEVTVLDEAGRMLAGPDAAGPEGGLSTAQLRMREEVESHLAEAGQSMLDQLLGPGRAVVRVAADLDLARTTSETNAVDPESQTVLSEELQEEAGEVGGATSTVRNYEVTRTTTRQEQEAGSIRALTVSVLLDEAAPPADPAAEADTPTPFTDDQLRQIESLVKNAVGFDEERGDRFAVQQLRFSTPAEAGGLLASADATVWAGLGLRYGIVLLVLLLAYRLLKRLADALAAPAEREALALDAAEADRLLGDGLAVGEDGELLGLPESAPVRATIEAVDDDPYAAKLSPEAQALANTSSLADDLRAAVDADPEAASNVVRAWLREDTPTA
ncbi:flagellar basal-body MS-ring/collar protein FliF [Rubrivirga marina]|uniref:Flagellar M-ring protein n=1 Tax=Rubrivirga marina TaxID=1196024 RepID=A0A271IXC8_9BACT|nr:flagellar basal-body MS-ring/collar protein FliF [Rubrivirga marina]PAP75770.1 flagellar M-ring protein FliF [Rubrivirga marina]